MQVLDKPDGEVAGLYIGDANGIQMLAHTARPKAVYYREHLREKHVVDHEWHRRRASRIRRSRKWVR